MSVAKKDRFFFEEKTRLTTVLVPAFLLIVVTFSIKLCYAQAPSAELKSTPNATTKPESSAHTDPRTVLSKILAQEEYAPRTVHKGYFHEIKRLIGKKLQNVITTIKDALLQIPTPSLRAPSWLDGSYEHFKSIASFLLKFLALFLAILLGIMIIRAIVHKFPRGIRTRTRPKKEPSLATQKTSEFSYETLDATLDGLLRLHSYLRDKLFSQRRLRSSLTDREALRLVDTHAGLHKHFSVSAHLVEKGLYAGIALESDKIQQLISNCRAEGI